MEPSDAVGELRPLRVGVDKGRRLVVVDSGGQVFALDVPQAIHFAKMLMHNVEALLAPPQDSKLFEGRDGS